MVAAQFANPGSLASIMRARWSNASCQAFVASREAAPRERASDGRGGNSRKEAAS